MTKKRMSKKKRTLLLVILIAVILIGTSLYTVVIRPSLQKEKITYEPSEVMRGTVKVTVNESGAIEYANSRIMYDLDLDFSDEDDEDEDEDEEVTVKYLVVEEVLKAPGEIVKEGDALIKFSAESIESVRKLLASAVADAQVDYNDARSEYELDCLEAEVEYKTQLINEKYAKALYSDASYKMGDNISSIEAEISMREGKTADLETKVSEAEEDYNEKYKAYIHQKDYYESWTTGGILYLDAQKSYLQAQTSYYNAQTALENARNALSENTKAISDLKTELSFAKASKKIDTIQTLQEYEETTQGGENAELIYASSLESLEETLKGEEDNLKKREEQKEAFELLVGEDGVVYAPGEGLVVEVGVEEGDELTSQKTMISYIKKDALTIAVDVTEEDVVSLEIGQNVNIVFTAYPDEQFVGVIKSIDTTATASNENTVSYPVVVSLEGDLTRMYGGMTAKVSFDIESSEDTLYINRKALVEKDGAYYVYVKEGLNVYVLRKVTIGLKNTSFVEILSGLEENETVYTAVSGA